MCLESGLVRRFHAAEERRRTSALSKQILFEGLLVKRFLLLF